MTGKISNGKGDHIYEVRGFLKETGCYGSESEWNIIPVIGSENKKYKKMCGKDIGYETLTYDEFEQCTEQQRDIYKKIIKWKHYCNDRGGKLVWNRENHLEFYTVLDEMEEYFGKLYETNIVPYIESLLEKI